MTIKISNAKIEDATALGEVLYEIIKLRGRIRPHDIHFILNNYIQNPTGILCSVASDKIGKTMGFQSLVNASAGNQFNVP